MQTCNPLMGSIGSCFVKTASNHSAGFDSTESMVQVFDPMVLLLTTLQAVTVSLVAYLVFLQVNSNKKAPGVEEPLPKETVTASKEVPVAKQSRSIRGVNIYGPYKKVSGLLCYQFCIYVIGLSAE